MGISVIIPCLNEEKYIRQCVLSILSNGYNINELEILVVDGGSQDTTHDIVNEIQKDSPQVRIIDNKHKKTPFALNLGVQNAKYEYILIAGAHAEYPSNYLNRLYELIQNPEIDIVGGAIDTRVKNETPKSKAIKFVLSHKLGVGNSSFRTESGKLAQVDTVPFGLYPKAVFQKAGLYNEKLIRNHDIELSKRILANGYKIWLDSTQKVVYYARETYQGLGKNNYGNGYWNIKTIFITRNFKSLSLRHFVPILFVLSLVLPLMLSLVYKPFILLTLLSASIYMLSILIIALVNSSKVSLIHSLLTFITLHLSYGFGSLMAFISKKH